MRRRTAVMNGWHATIKTIWGERMADRRMLTKKVTDSDEFISLPSSAQALYLHLNMGADDDGFNNQVQLAMYKAHASVDDVKILLAKRYIIQFESGVIVIKHWRLSNAIRKDRYTPTSYQEEFKRLGLKVNGSYTVAKWLPDGCQMVAVGKDSIGKVSEGKDKDKTKRFTPPTLDEVKAYCEERKNNVSAERFIDYYTSNGWMVGRNKMKDWKACVRSWEKNQFGTHKKNQSVPDYMIQEEPKEKGKLW